MLAKLSIQIQGQGLNGNMGSIFHGYLMSIIDPDYANYLHYNQIKPYTSCIYRNLSGQWIWRLTTLNELAKEMIIDPLLLLKDAQIYLEQKNVEVEIVSKEIVIAEEEELFLDPKRNSSIRFITPSSYKSGGKTHIFPEISTMMEGVVNKINQFSKNIKLEDEETIRRLLENVQINSYNLKTQDFFLEQIKIRGFVGKINIGLSKDKELAPLLHFLLEYSQYTGMGIKTALGMGGIEIEQSERTTKQHDRTRREDGTSTH